MLIELADFRAQESNLFVKLFANLSSVLTNTFIDLVAYVSKIPVSFFSERMELYNELFQQHVEPWVRIRPDARTVYRIPEWEDDTPTFPETVGVCQILFERGFTIDHRGVEGNVHYEEYW